MSRRLSIIALAIFASVAPPAARAADSPEPALPDKTAPAAAEGPTDKLSWLLTPDEELPDPPLIRARAGAVIWPYLRTNIRIGRKGDLRGREIENIEDKGGLPGRWVSPSFEATAGSTLRAGISWLDLFRQGEFERTDEVIDVGAGRILARPNDFVQFEIHYTQVDLYAQYDIFRSARLRIGLIGGARIIRFTTRIAGIQPDTLNYQSIATNDWLASPLVGGQVELEPVSSFTFFTSIRFIDWAWRAIGLREERAFELHVGCAVEFIENMLSAALDFRFLSVFVDPSDLNGGKNLAEYHLDAGGLGLSIVLKY